MTSYTTNLSVLNISGKRRPITKLYQPHSGPITKLYHPQPGDVQIDCTVSYNHLNEPNRSYYGVRYQIQKEISPEQHINHIFLTLITVLIVSILLLLVILFVRRRQVFSY